MKLKHGDSTGRREGGWNYACASHLICIFIKIPYTIRRTIGSSVRAWSGGELAGKASSHSQIVSNGIRGASSRLRSRFFAAQAPPFLLDGIQLIT